MVRSCAHDDQWWCQQQLGNAHEETVAGRSTSFRWDTTDFWSQYPPFVCMPTELICAPPPTSALPICPVCWKLVGMPIMDRSIRGRGLVACWAGCCTIQQRNIMTAFISLVAVASVLLLLHLPLPLNPQSARDPSFLCPILWSGGCCSSEQHWSTALTTTIRCSVGRQLCESKKNPISNSCSQKCKL